MTVYDLPPINASLNATSACLLLLGFYFIKSGRKKAHIVCMGSALVTSTAFLTCYLVYHHYAGSVKFTAQGPVRVVYFGVLLSHTLLAAVLPFMVGFTVVPALRAKWDRHRRLARWTLPVWLYVSATGVLIYLMLYRWFPSTELVGR